jgi:hypothetical protein
LSEAEKLYFAVQLLEGEVYNGGFDQYFFNSSGSYYRYAVLGLKELEAAQALALLEEAKQILFNSADVPEDPGHRRQLLRERSSVARTQCLEQLDKLYWKDPDGLWPRCEAFARKHGLV